MKAQPSLKKSLAKPRPRVLVATLPPVFPEEAIGLFKCINKAIDHNHQKHCLLVNA